MKKKNYVCQVMLILLSFYFINAQVTDELKAFPSAEGAGKYVVGARGGQVIKVKNLNQSGNESLQQALTAEGKQYIVFDTAGMITYFAPTSEHDKYGILPLSDLDNGKTVFGQSAFRNGGQGITIRGSDTFSGATIGGSFGNLSWRYSRLMRGAGVMGENSGDNFEPYNAVGKGKIILDHMNFFWSTDENVSFSLMDGYTLQYSIIAEGLYLATHKYTQSNPTVGHSKGSLTSEVPEMTHFGNYYVSNDERTPLVQAMRNGITKIEVINNIIYNWGYFAVQISPMDIYPRNLNIYEGTLEMDFIGNILKKGPNTNSRRYGFLWPDRKVYPSGNGEDNTVTNYDNFKLFVSDNNSQKITKDDPWDVVGAWDDNTGALSESNHAKSARIHDFLDDSKITLSSSLTGELFEHVGASIYKDSHHKRVIDSYADNSAQLVNMDGSGTEAPYGTAVEFSSKKINGWDTYANMIAPVDSNDNGIEDEFEVAGATFPNGIKIPLDVVLTDEGHNQVLTTFEKDNKIWYNPGYELIEVRYFTDLDILAMTWVSIDDTITPSDPHRFLWPWHWLQLN